VRQLAVGQNDFVKNRRKNSLYVDKTQYLERLLKIKAPCLLTRPPFFGKTLLIRTLKHILLGEWERFLGLKISDAAYDWPVYPVINIDMDRFFSLSDVKLEKDLSTFLSLISERLDIKLAKQEPQFMLEGLLRRFAAQSGQKVALLIDGYDGPVLNRLKDDPAMAKRILSALDRFYGAIKTSEDHLSHVFITGVARFSRDLIFSDLDNLVDLTFDRRFAGVCGLAEKEVKKVLDSYKDKPLAASVGRDGFLPPGSQAEDLFREFQTWFSGHSWDGRTRVYHPYATLDLLQWLIDPKDWVKRPQKVGLPCPQKAFFESLKWLKDPLTGFDPERAVINDVASLDPLIALFQNGYLTVKEFKPKAKIDRYVVECPNLEARAALAPLTFQLPAPNSGYLSSKFAARVVKRFFSLGADEGPGDINGEGQAAEPLSDYLTTYPAPEETAPEREHLAWLEMVLVLAKRRYQTITTKSSGTYFLLNGPKDQSWLLALRPYVGKKRPRNIADENQSSKKAQRLYADMRKQAEKVLEEMSLGPALKNPMVEKKLRMVAIITCARLISLIKFKAVEDGELMTGGPEGSREFWPGPGQLESDKISPEALKTIGLILKKHGFDL
jgi:hypothetical protein